MAFIETQFPSSIQYSSSGGPQWRTEIVELNGGQEQRNTIWDDTRHRYNISEFKTDNDIDTIIRFFHAMQGQYHGFRLKDWADYRTGSNYAAPSATDHILVGTVDGVNTDFQLVKRYTVSTNEYVRYIKKPVNGTVLVSLDDVTKTETTDYTVDYTTGIVTFNTAPTVEVVKGGCEFDVPVRFDTDTLDLHHSSYQAITASIPIVEIRV